MRHWGWVAAGWAGAFAALHLFWALGGSTGLASSAGTELAAERPGWFVAGGLWGVTALLLVAAALGAALTRARRRRALVLAGVAVGLVLLLRGLGIEALLLAGAYDGNAAMSDSQRHWSLVVWNPWFVLGGLGFLLAARAPGRSLTRRGGGAPRRRG